ncbi:hypothetical protein [Filomicrobium sp.]|uniref:hypothetical protein n=1 Tax=Filomicrobium sp. TaxID=2024831 RepID=UPI00258B09C6|nr:hypothetical protein [Filomicrobium sp.]MCV0371732.1 hypothetical protein [Filomicrobium sp.]
MTESSEERQKRKLEISEAAANAFLVSSGEKARKVTVELMDHWTLLEFCVTPVLGSTGSFFARSTLTIDKKTALVLGDAFGDLWRRGCLVLDAKPKEDGVG